MQSLPTDILLGLVVSHLLEWLKRTPLVPWIQTVGQPRLKAILAAVLSLAGALGIAYSLDTNTGTLVITGLTWANIEQSVRSWITAWVTAQTYYRGIRGSGNGPIMALPGTGLTEDAVRAHARETVAALFAQVANSLRVPAEAPASAPPDANDDLAKRFGQPRFGQDQVKTSSKESL